MPLKTYTTIQGDMWDLIAKKVVALKPSGIRTFFDLLENFIMNECGWENMNEEMFCSNEYVQLEYSREKRDLERIQKGEYVQDSGSEMLIQINPYFLRKSPFYI